MRAPHKLGIRLPLAIVGWVLIGTGVSALLRSGWGVAPYDVFTSGLARSSGLEVGTASWIAAAACVVLAFFLGQRPGWGTLGGAFAVGLVINLWLSMLPTSLSGGVAFTVALAVVGLAALLFGAACTIVAGLGAGGVELLMLAVSRLHLRGNSPIGVTRARWALEALLCLSGWALGGAVGVMTLVSVVVSGPAFGYLLPHMHRWFRLPNTPVLNDGDLGGR